MVDNRYNYIYNWYENVTAELLDLSSKIYRIKSLLEDTLENSVFKDLPGKSKTIKKDIEDMLKKTDKILFVIDKIKEDIEREKTYVLMD